MLEPIRHLLASKHLVLASSSPRRKQILGNVGLKFDIVPSTFEENLDKSTFKHPFEYAMATARCKTMDVAKNLLEQNHPVDLVIGADTVLSMDGEIIEKPRDEEDAFKRLCSFRGRMHTVYTGVVLVQPRVPPYEGSSDEFATLQFYEATDVHFVKCSDDVIRQYIKTGESWNKAGGYGIQGVGGTLVESITGDYFNVMGFPLCRFSKELSKIYAEQIS